MKISQYKTDRTIPKNKMPPLHSVTILIVLLVFSFQLLPTENWKGTASEGSESSKRVHDQHKCLILDESSSIIYLILLRAPQRRVILYSPAKLSPIPSWGQWFAKIHATFFTLMQKNLKVIKPVLLTAPAVTNKAANEEKNCPYHLIPKSPAIFTQECCDKWYFSPF